MKSENSMRNKFQAYLNKVGKVTGQTSVQKPKLSKQRFLITQADTLSSALDGLPLNEWSEDDRNDLFNSLAGIHSKTEVLHNTVNPLPAPKEQINPSDLSTNLA